MLVYITQSAKTTLAPITVRGLPLWHLAVGGGFFARRRAAAFCMIPQNVSAFQSLMPIPPGQYRADNSVHAGTANLHDLLFQLYARFQ